MASGLERYAPGRTNAASLARQAPAVYVGEDAHWIDKVSELLIADFLSVIPQTPSLVLLTYPPSTRERWRGCTVRRRSPLRR
jgi:predicted ATPase